MDRTTTTSADGTYSFTNLGPGMYRVRAQLQPGWMRTTANPADVTTHSGTNVIGLDFGNYLPPLTIIGQVFEDRDGDGVMDTDELGLGGWMIELDAGVDGSVDFTTTTDGHGRYAFSGLPTDTYRVQQRLDGDWIQTTADQADIVLGPADIVLGIDFGNFRLITIAGRQFSDLNGDGSDNAGADPSLADWTIALEAGADGSVDATTTTGPDGTYSFSNLGPGTYRVRALLQAGWTQTSTDPADIIATSGSDRNNIDFGAFQLITISGRTFQDSDGDGLFGPGDFGLDGWTVFLDADGDGEFDETELQTTTDSDGNYTFSDLGPGVYRARAVPQQGWMLTTPNPANIQATSGTPVANVDFGNFQLGVINGRVFNDLNGDGTDADGDEPGLTDWTIELDFGADGTVDATTTANADGAYRFSDLLPGTYRVRQVMQPGWRQTTANPSDIVATSGLNLIGIEFGNFRLPRINVRQFDDITGDGITPDDQPLAGWTIRLFRDAGDGQFDPLSDPLIEAVTTDSSGVAQFFVELPGTYFVEQEVRADFTNTAGPLFYTVSVSGDVSGELFAGNNFATFQNIAILGFKINDLDGDGVTEGGEFGIGGWTIFLDANDNGMLDDGEQSTTTQGFGNYNFPNLGPGTYRVREVLQPGWVQVSLNPNVIVAHSGQDVSNVDFLNFQLITIHGVKFHDLNGDGINDPSEPPQMGWMIFIDDNDNGMVDEGERSTTTDAAGEYIFANLGPGTYRLREVLQPGWILVTGPGNLFASSGHNVSNANFANFQLITVSGHNFEDHNGNGVRDIEDEAMQGVTIFIDDNDNGVLDPAETSTVTGADGHFVFTSVGPGVLLVREVVSPGFAQTTPVRNIVALGGQDVPQVDFGNFRLITISGEKFNDVNGDGMRQPGELGLAGWVIFIDANDNGILGSTESRTTTDANGRYTLTDVGPGLHRVREAITLEPGWMQTTADPADIAAASGVDVTAINFGNFRLITISGQKFEDRDGDGLKDPGEIGLAGWTIYLDDNANDTLDAGERSVSTGSDGHYSFPGLGPGEYRVREVLQTGWVRTAPGMLTTVVHIAESGRDLPDVHFGNFRLITITGRKFLDVNANGTLDAGEAGLPGWTIFLDKNGNGVRDNGEVSVVTDASGTFTFTGVGPGTHHIAEIAQDGFRQITVLSPIAATSGIDVSGQDLGNLPQNTARLIQDPFDPNKTALLVAGSDSNDRIRVIKAGKGRLTASINGQRIGPFQPDGHIIILAFEGDDHATVARRIGMVAEVDGGEGSDTLAGGAGDDILQGGEGDDMMRGRAGDDHMDSGYGSNHMRGGRGNDMLRGGEENDFMLGGRGRDIMVGMDGNDKMLGGRGRDLMVGGDGADRMDGDRKNSQSRQNTQRQANSGTRGRNQDILIGGTTDYDEDDEALEAILAEWTARRSYDSRVQNVAGAGARSSALNEDFVLDSFTVHDDAIADRIRGGAGLDWFFASNDGPTRDMIRGRSLAELLDTLDSL